MKIHLNKIVLIAFLFAIPSFTYVVGIMLLENKPIEIKNLVNGFLSALLLGAFMGLCTPKNSYIKTIRSPRKFIQSYLLIIAIILIYFVLYKILLIPNNLADNLLNEALLIALLSISILIEKRLRKPE